MIRGFKCVCIRSSLHSVRFGQLLHCAHKRIVNIVKVYIERNNIQVELMLFRKKYRSEMIPEPLCLQPMRVTDNIIIT